MEYDFVLEQKEKINILIPMLKVSNLKHRKDNQGGIREYRNLKVHTLHPPLCSIID